MMTVKQTKCTNCDNTASAITVYEKPLCPSCEETEKHKSECNEEVEVGSDIFCDFPKGHPEDYHEGLLTYREVSITHKTGFKAIGRVQWMAMTPEEVEEFIK